MVWYGKIKIVDKLDISNSREELINLYHKYFILLNGYDKMDAYLKVTKNSIDNYLDKDIYEYAKNYKDAVKMVNSLNNNDNYLCIYKNNKLEGISRFKIIGKNLRIYELICNNKQYNRVLKYIEKEYNNIKKIYLEIPINDIKLLVLSNKLGYIEDTKDIDNNQKYIVNKVIK